MNLKNIYFSWLIYWGKMKGLLNGIAEAIILLASLASFFVLIYQFGFVQTPDSVHILERSRPFILLAFFTGITLRYVVRFQEIIQEKMLYLDISIYFLLFAVLSSKIFFKDAIAHSLPYLSFLTKPLFVYVLLLLLSTIHLSRQTFTLMQTRIKPSLLFLLSFVFVILVGAGLLSLPNATTHRIPFIDALFISTTSVCVTGLTTVDVATCFTHIGHIIILILIQIGGIGVMTFTSFFALSFMGKSSFTSKMMLKDMLNEDRTGGLFRVILNILFVTLFIEGIGAYFIYMDVRGSLPGGTQQELFYAMFHAVSAFCNAGFDLLGVRTPFSSLTSYAANPVINFTIMFLIVVGGIGFLTWDDIRANRLHLRKYRMQSKVILCTTAVLLIVPAMYFYFFEFDDLTRKERLLSSLFQAVTPRTAGFNTVELTDLSEAGQFITIALMLIGGSPGSTAGGLKTTTIAVLFTTAISTFRRRENANIFGRRIDDDVVKNAATISLMYITLCCTGGLIISVSEGLPMITCLFETASAVGTVGLSLGITPELNLLSRVVLILLMFFGRVGGLTLIFAALSGVQKKVSKLPKEKITVG